MQIALILGGVDEVQGHLQADAEAERDGFEGMWFDQFLGSDVLSAVALACLSASLAP